MPSIRSKFPLIPLLAFAITLLIAAFFMGDIGVYNDDYFCNQRDAATGQIHDLIMTRPWHLWRPLTRLVLTPLITTLWPHPWMLHAISALLHGAVVGLLYALLRRLGIRSVLAGCAALGFMVYPIHFEALLWSAIICTLLSVVLLLTIWHGYLWWLTSSYTHPLVLRAIALPGFGLLAFSVAAFNEQPAGPLAALILAPLIVGLAKGASPGRRLLRSALPLLAVTIGLALYIRGFFHHFPGNVREDRRETAVDGLPFRLHDLGEKIPRELFLRDFGAGAFHTGIDSIAAHPLRAVLAFGPLLVLGLAWVFRADDDRPLPRSPDPQPRGLAITALGLVWSLCAWLPVAASHTITSPRLHYVSSLGLAIAAAGVATLAARLLARAALGASPRIVLRLAFASAILSALPVWIGIQTNFQRRCAADRAEIQPLVVAFGSTLEPDTLVLPVHISSRISKTNSPRFDNYFQQCWAWDFSSGWRVQSCLRSPTAWTVQTVNGVASDGLWISDDDPEHVGVLRAHITRPRPPHLETLFPRTPDHQGRDVPWDKVILCDIDAPGQTLIITKLRLHIPGREPVEIVPRQVAISPACSALPPRILDVYPIPPDRRHAASDAGSGRPHRLTTDSAPGRAHAQLPR